MDSDAKRRPNQVVSFERGVAATLEVRVLAQHKQSIDRLSSGTKGAMKRENDARNKGTPAAWASWGQSQMAVISGVKVPLRGLFDSPMFNSDRGAR